MFGKMEKHADLVHAMADKAGIDVGRNILNGRLGATKLREAVMLCTNCRNVGACETALADQDSHSVPEFCLNKPIFDALAP